MPSDSSLTGTGEPGGQEPRRHHAGCQQGGNPVSADWSRLRSCRPEVHGRLSRGVRGRY